MVSYAFGGTPGYACGTNRLTGDHEHHYSTPGVIGSDFAKPIPIHAQTQGALDAVESLRRLGRVKRTAELVTDHGNPRRLPYAHDVPKTAVALASLAERAGFEVKRIGVGDYYTVEGFDRAQGVGFRCVWRAGKADSGTWHEMRYRYAMVEDTRPIGLDKTARVGLKGKRSLGMGETHLSIVASPSGVSLGVTAVTARVKEHAYG